MVATLCFIWGAFMYVVGTYTSFFGGSLNLVPILIGGYIILFVGLHLYERKYWTNIVVDQGLTQLSKELYDVLLKQQGVEEGLGVKLQGVVDKLTYAPLKLLLLNVTLDTEKHGKLLKNIIKILSHEQTVPSNEAFRREVDQVREVLEEHVHIEEDIGKKVGAVMKTVDSRVLRALLKTIRDDEMAHHTMFQMVLRTYGST
ncbi:hypothetical protein HQ586_07975 [Candidatus Bathyarchaeota archaeon]|nr:hypothetical protein [Candidatus Bathyarchaeota archaeon]